MKLKSLYMIFDDKGNPKLDSLRYHRKNSLNTIEAREWQILSKQGWVCERVNITIEKQEK